MADKQANTDKKASEDKKPAQKRSETKKANIKASKENKASTSTADTAVQKDGSKEKGRIPLDEILQNMDNLMPSPDQNTPKIPKYSTPKSTTPSSEIPSVSYPYKVASVDKRVTFDPIPQYLTQNFTVSKSQMQSQGNQNVGSPAQQPIMHTQAQLPAPSTPNMQPVYQGLQQPTMQMPMYPYMPQMYPMQMPMYSPQMQMQMPQQQMQMPQQQMQMPQQQMQVPQQQMQMPQQQMQVPQQYQAQVPQYQRQRVPQQVRSPPNFVQPNFDDSIQELEQGEIAEESIQMVDQIPHAQPEEEIDIDVLEEQWLEGSSPEVPIPQVVDISQEEEPEGIDMLGEQMGPVPMDELQGALFDEGWIWDELETDGEEVGPPCSETIKTVADRLWNLGITNTKIMKIKEAYASFYRPSNIENLTPTNLNQVLTETILPQGKGNRDKLPRSLQNGIIKAALGLVKVFSGIHAPKVPEFEGKRESLLNLIKVIRILAYLNGKVNFLRRIQMKPFMARQYHKLCDKVTTPSHQLLMGEDFAESVRERNAMFRLGRNVKNPRNSGGPATRGGRNAGGRRDRNQFQPYPNQNLRVFTKYDRYGNPFQIGEYDQFNSIQGNVIQYVQYNQEHMSCQSLNTFISPGDIGMDCNAQYFTPGEIGNAIINSFCSGTSQTTISESELPGIQPRWFPEPIPIPTCSTVQQRPRTETTRTQQQGQTWQTELEPQQTTSNNEQVILPTYLSEIYIKEEFLVGGIAHKIQEWRTLTSDPEILQYVQGVKLDFVDQPVQDKLPHPIVFTKAEEVMVRKEIQRFKKLGILKTSELCPGDYVSNLFARPKKEPGRVRLILNLKKLNTDWVRFIHFKMDGVEDVINLIRPGVYMASIDFEMSFYSISVHPEYRRYLKAICLDEILEFQALPMGYSQSPLIFCKLLKVPLSHLREQFGYTNSAFVDDVFMAEDTLPETQENVKDSVVLFDDLGYTVNMIKSHTFPATKKPHLGLIFNSIEMSISLTQEKIEKFLDHAQKILREDKHTIRSVASLIGQMNAARYAVRYGPLHTKALEIAKNKALGSSGKDFEALMTLSKLDKLDIKWWMDTIPQSKFYFGYDPIDKVIHTDASTKGYGFWCEATNQRGGGRWSAEEAQAHINPMEIWAVGLSIKSLFPEQENLHIKVFCDSQVAISCISRQGSTKSIACNAATRKVLLYCEKQNIRLTMQHIPTDKNIFADFESRNFRNEDTEWSLDQRIFDRMCQLLNFTPTIDLFADRLNKKVPVYCSWELDPEAAYIDAFATDWSVLSDMYCFCPFSLVGTILRQFLMTPGHRKMLMVTPMWPTQSWYSTLLNHAITPPIIIPVKAGTLRLEHKPHKKHPLEGKLRLLGVIISSDPLLPKAFRQQWQTPCAMLEQRLLTSNISQSMPGGKHFVIKGKLVKGIHI